MALGARADRLMMRAISESLRIGVLGVVIGVLLASWASRLVARFLFGIEASDPWTYGGAAILALAVCGLAALLPARRVTALNPARVLRDE